MLTLRRAVSEGCTANNNLKREDYEHFFESGATHQPFAPR